MKNLTSFIQEKLHVSKYKNEDFNLNRDDLDYISDILFDSGEHTGFRKGCSIYEIETDDLENRIKKSYRSDADEIPKDFYKIIKKNASENVLAIFGDGYDGTWAIVIFISTDPYTFIISKNGYNISELYKIKDEKKVTDKILDFCY
jgi:hypothetical protein